MKRLNTDQVAPVEHDLRQEAEGRAGGLVQGKVVQIEGAERFAIMIGQEEVWAARSLSCLLEPAVGDRVLLARVDGEAFVLAVLDRLLPDVMTLSIPRASRVELRAADIAVRAEERLVLHGREASVEGERVRLLAKSFNLVSQMVTFVTEALRSTAHRHETIANQMMVRAGDRTTHVTGVDVSEIGTLVQKVEQVSSHTAQTAIMTAEDDLRFDGKRVTVG